MKNMYNICRVETFAEIRIRYHDGFEVVKCTNIAEGDFPEWNEVITFELECLDGKKFTKEELENSNTMIYISIFDREVYHDDSDYSSDIKFKVEEKFLGSFQIPLTSILANPPKMEGMFKVNRPLTLFDYVVLNENILIMEDKDRVSQTPKTNEELPSYVSLSISLDPVLEIPVENELEYYPGRESSSLLIAATDWAKAVKALFPKRYIKVFGENIEGQSTLICRYLVE